MKQIIFISLAIFISGVSYADTPAQPVIQVKTMTTTKAAAELISARIKSALEGKPYVLAEACDGDSCKTGPR